MQAGLIRLDLLAAAAALESVVVEATLVTLRDALATLPADLGGPDARAASVATPA